MQTTYLRLARRQLSRSIQPFAAQVRSPAPASGWITAIRVALGMTYDQIAGRLSIGRASAVRQEQRERDETISLGALRRAAHALDCDLVYAFVPRGADVTVSADDALDTLIALRARAVAERELERVAHTMLLEAQPVDAREMRAQIDERAIELMRQPRRLWDPDA